MSDVTTIDGLKALYKAPTERVLKKQLQRLDKHCRRYIELSPFAVLATGSGDGDFDASPKGGLPGFVQILDDETLLVPDWPGNNRLDSLKNLLRCPGMALLFMIPGVDEILRVNGTARISTDAELRRRFDIEGKQPKTVIVVSIREAYLHCPKALMRAELWNPAKRPGERPLPTLSQMIGEQVGDPRTPETQEQMVTRMRGELWER